MRSQAIQSTKIMKNYFNLFCIVNLFIFLAGCTTLNRIMYPVPPATYTSNISYEKTILVIPFNHYSNQIEAAGKVEMALTNYGFNVKSYITSSKNIEKTTGEGNSSSVGQERQNAIRVTESYRLQEVPDTDLVFEALLSSGRITVKVIDKKNQSLIGVSSFSQYSVDTIFRDFLLNKNLIKKTDPH